MDPNYQAEFRLEVIKLAEEMLDQGYSEGDTEWMTLFVTSDSDMDIPLILRNAIKKDNFTFAFNITQHKKYRGKEIGQPLCHVVCHGSVECVQRFLVEHHYYPEVNHYLILTTSLGHDYCCLSEQDYPAVIGNSRYSLLSLAARHNPKVLRVLLENGADLDNVLHKDLLCELVITECQPEEGDQANFVDIVKSLLDSGLKIRAQDLPIESPLYQLCNNVLRNIDFVVSDSAKRQPQTSVDSSFSPDDSLPDSMRQSLTRSNPVVIQNGRLLLNVYGSEIRECVDFLASKSPNEELLMALEASIFQILCVICMEMKGRRGLVAGTNQISPLLNCILDLANSVLDYYDDLDYTQCSNFHLCDCLFKLLFDYRELFNDYHVYLDAPLLFLKLVVRFKSLRKVGQTDTLTQLVLHDCGLYTPFIEAFVFHQMDKESRDLFAKLKECCGVFGDRFPDANTELKRILNDKLTTPLSLKHATRKCIVQSLGGTVRPEMVQTLPLPLALRTFILG